MKQKHDQCIILLNNSIEFIFIPAHNKIHKKINTRIDFMTSRKRHYKLKITSGATKWWNTNFFTTPWIWVLNARV